MLVAPLLVFAARFAGPTLDRIALISGPGAINRRSEFAIDLRAAYENPFDPSEVALDAIVTSPRGRSLRIPGFLYRPFARSEGKGTMLIAYSSTEAAATGKAGKEKSFEKGEILTPTGAAAWRLRFTPTEAGKYRFVFVLKDRNGETRKPGPVLQVSKGAAAGFVRVDPRNPRAFRLSTGQPFFPIGANIGWAGERGTRDYDDWLTEYGKVGANWGRVWLSPSWTTFALEPPHRAGEIDLANAWRLDYVLQEAEQKGIRLAFCIDSYNVLRDRINWPEWERSPYNGGGSKPSEFWTDPAAARRYRNKLRYLVARWGADPGVFSWEFWNEVDGISDYKVGPVRDWHRSMATYLRSIDSYRHLISTSFGGNGSGAGDASVFALPEIDYSVSHLYDAPDGPVSVVEAQRRLGKLGKPHFVAEFGADASGSRGDEDPEGLQLHDSLWSSLAAGSSGGSMLWWWDSYIHPRRLYPQLASLKSFMAGLDWGRAHLEEVPVRVDFQNPPKEFPRRDIRLEGGVADWSPSEFNRPRTIRIDRDGAHGNVAGFLHGTGNHADLHNPVTFETDLPWPTTLDVQVGDVSGYGGAGLRITLDGQKVRDESFPDPDGDRVTTTLKQFAGTRTFPLAAGRHRIVIENTGQDWARVDYRFVNAGVRTAPPVIAWACAGPDVAFVWARHEDQNWRNVIERKQQPIPTPPSYVILKALKPGVWKATIWDTWTAKRIAERRVVVDDRGQCKVALPSIAKDLAVKLVRSSSASASLR